MWPSVSPSIDCICRDFSLRWKCKKDLNAIILFFPPFFKKNLFIYLFWLHWVFVAVRGLSLVAESGDYSSLRCMGFSLQWLLLLWSTGSRHTGFSSCSTRAQQLWLTGPRAQAQQLQRMGLVAPWHVGSSQTRAQTRVPCIGRRILNHCATTEAPFPLFMSIIPFKRFILQRPMLSLQVWFYLLNSTTQGGQSPQKSCQHSTRRIHYS